MIEFADVTFAYERFGASQVGGVSHLDLSVSAGSCVLVCGPSGCGKTTVTRLANGLAPAYFPGTLSGCVLIDGRDCARMRSWEIALSVGSVFQNPRTQFFNVDATGEVAFALESRSMPQEQIRTLVAETMDDLGIGHLAGRSIFSLSGGEKQRIAYAGAWVGRPSNLVLDEPTSNLDMAAIMDLRSYVAAAKAVGSSILVAEHRLWWLEGIVDEIAVMENGTIVRRFSPREFAQLSNQEVRSLGLRTRSIGDVVASKRDGAAFLPRTEEGLTVRGLRAGYRKREVLSDVDMTARAGEVVALVGKNGVGKTTLSRVICGLAKGSGSFLLFGKKAGARERLKKSSMVFQDANYQLFADSVAAEVVFGMSRKCSRGVDVEGILSALGLKDEAQRHPATLSGGQKQRLAVASCIAAGKDVLVFDEPTSGLDFASMQQVACLIRCLAAEGRVVLVVTHDLEFIACACDRAIELSGGVAAASYDVEEDIDAIRHALFAGSRQTWKQQ